jgi:hypothetical protein
MKTGAVEGSLYSLPLPTARREFFPHRQMPRLIFQLFGDGCTTCHPDQSRSARDGAVEGSAVVFLVTNAYPIPQTSE